MNESCLRVSSREGSTGSGDGETSASSAGASQDELCLCLAPVQWCGVRAGTGHATAEPGAGHLPGC